MKPLEITDACVKAFAKKIGAPKTKLTLLAPLSPALAREIGVFSEVFTQEGLPKQKIIEAELDVRKSAPFDLRLQVANIADVLHVGACTEAIEWIAKRKGSTKKGQVSRLLLEFKVLFPGSAIGVFEWLEKYGQALGTLTLGNAPEQQELHEEPKKKPGRTKKHAEPALASVTEMKHLVTDDGEVIQ